MSTIQFPKPLSHGDTIGIISPASPQRDESRLFRGIEYLQQKGFKVHLGKNALAKYGGYLAGTDEERIADIEEMFTNPEISAIFCARGGYGTPRLLKKLNYDLIAANPKMFVGFSDTTALQCAIFKRTGLITYSGAMPSVDMADGFDEWSERVFWQAMLSDKPLGSLEQTSSIMPLYEGKAEGRLMGGNLSLLANLCGTPYAPDWEGCILICEDIGEEPYRIDRLLCQLENAGVFDSIVGMAFGQFNDSSLRPTSVEQQSVEEIISEYANKAGVPAIMNVMYGHQKIKWTLPIGAKTVIDGTTGSMTILE